MRDLGAVLDQQVPRRARHAIRCSGVAGSPAPRRHQLVPFRVNLKMQVACLTLRARRA
jgi:hypothetical protein